MAEVATMIFNAVEEINFPRSETIENFSDYDNRMTTNLDFSQVRTS
jgi:hypothetical protein